MGSVRVCSDVCACRRGGAEEAEDVICDSGSPAVTIVLLTVYSKFPMGLRVSRGM